MPQVSKQVEETLARYGEPVAGNVWFVQGQTVILHKCLERIAARALISFEKPEVVRAEKEEAVVLIGGHIPVLNDKGHREWDQTEVDDKGNRKFIPRRRTEWSFGEALVGANYRISGKQAAYVWAMAEKRAKDRVILKLLELHGYAYSDEETEEFRRPSREEEMGEALASNQPVQRADGEVRPENVLRRRIDERKTIDSVTDFMLKEETRKALDALDEGTRNSVRQYAKDRLIALGWTGKARTQRPEAAPEPRSEAQGESAPEGETAEGPEADGSLEEGQERLDDGVDWEDELGHMATLIQSADTAGKIEAHLEGFENSDPPMSFRERARDLATKFSKILAEQQDKPGLPPDKVEYDLNEWINRIRECKAAPELSIVEDRIAHWVKVAKPPKEDVDGLRGVVMERRKWLERPTR